MRKSITQTLVRGLKPAAKPYEVRDPALRGFLVRVQPSGAASYIVEYQRHRRITLGPTAVLTLDRARALAKDVLAAATREEATHEALRAIVRPAQPGLLTLRQFLEQIYAPWLQAHRRRGPEDVARICAQFAEALDRPLSELSAWLVEKWRLRRRQLGRATVTVNRDLAPLKAALARAVEWGHLQANPLAGVKLARADDNTRIRFLSDEEEARLRAALQARELALRAARERFITWRTGRSLPPPAPHGAGYADHLQPMVLVSINTGIRQGELFALRWSDVDLDRRQLTVRAAAAKGGRARRVPLNAEACEALERWRDQAAACEPEALVFPGRTGERFDNVKKAWSAVLQAAGISGFRWHDLRHTFASKLVMRGVDLNTVRELLGHVDLKMTLRYAHLAPGHLAEAVARLDAPAGVSAETVAATGSRA